MNERITLISLFDKNNMHKINSILKAVDEATCKVPFGKNVDDRVIADTLPYHFTLFSWNIKKELKVIEFLKNVKFSCFKILVDKIDIVEGNENSYVLYLNIVKNNYLYEMQKYIYEKFPSNYYNPDLFNFHITIHIDKNYNRIASIKEKIQQNFIPFELEVSKIGLFEIYPAKLVNEISLKHK